MLTLQTAQARSFLASHECEQLLPQAKLAMSQLLDGTGPGHDFLGWVHLPTNYDQAEYARLKDAAKRISETSDVLVVVGIGGSYLGARAVIDLLSPSFSALKPAEKRQNPLILYAGHQLSGRYLAELLEVLDHYEVSLNVISKSGTTTEPAVAFRVLRQYMEKRYGKAESIKRIYCTTDRAKGALKALADQEGYETFTVPDDVGGRFSVLTSVGLLPIAVAGIDIDQLMAGAKAAHDQYTQSCDLNNPVIAYAVVRNCLMRKGYDIELLVNYDPYLHYMTEWWKQLYGESEGKDGRGLFPAGVDFTTDLHSMGQYIQAGKRHLIETVISFGAQEDDVVIPQEASNGDGLNFLSGKTLHDVNHQAMQGTVLAHVDGGVPNLGIRLDRCDAYHCGALIYFFELACGVSGYINAINPFDQPGVEAYKKNMYALLGKPGYEAEGEALLARLESI